LAEFDHVVLIDTKKSLRLKRLEGRGVDKKRAKRIMAVQPPMKALRRHADVIILNNGTKETLYEKASMVADILNR
ncbi:MAG: dephospho-CoA kinase, partial [Clostridia bacterium]|nr:dephospho-CoA kinase [Clostridia bacterium]